uniref:LRRCT domain-containing protein n=1 Tax=Glossina brevipalpis TaxID=37001 RepID=A0A1A9WGQ7_9MUSC
MTSKLFMNLSLFMVFSYVVALANCPSGCQCDDNTLIVQCGEGQLDVLPIALNPSIQRLIIRSNKIKTIDSSMQFYTELTFLDLSSNHLVNIPQHTFAYQRKLQEIHLNHNKIGQINNKTFVGLSAVTVLNLRGNLISELHQGCLTSLTRIEELNLGENRIGFIDPKAFDGLSQLRILYLDDNALTSIPDPVHFQAMPSLAEVYLGMNSLLIISSSAFQNLKGLTLLNLKGAGLRNISHDSFHGLEALRSLDLSDNRLSRIPTISLSPLQRLESLNLGQNDFEVVLEGAFAGLKQLKHLDITGCLRLKRIMNGAFASNSNLETLNLSSNKMLIEVQEGALSGLPYLRVVSFKANALTTLAEGLFPWKDLSTLDISENPIACDCRIMWLRNLLLNKNITGDLINEVICEFPEALRGEELKSLNPTMLGCSHTDPRKQALIGALLVGTAATITALALILYRCRHKIREYVKGDIWGNSALGRKEREYQKTFCDEDYMTRHHPHPCSLVIHSTTTFPNTYTPHHPGQQHYGPICSTPITDLSADSQKNFQQLQVPNNSIINDKKLLKPCVVDDSPPFVMHMKNSMNNSILNHYTKPHFLQQTAVVGDSCYSYADLPIVHSDIQEQKTNSHHQQQNSNYHHTSTLHYDTSHDYNNTLGRLEADDIDPNYIYSNTHYSLPLEQSRSRSKISTPSPIPPELPLRNPPQSLQANTTERRSFMKCKYGKSSRSVLRNQQEQGQTMHNYH